MRVGAGTLHARRASTWYCVSDAIVSCWVSVDAGGARVDEEEVDVGRRRRRCGRARRARSPADANGTCHLMPSSTKPSPSAVAVDLHAARAEAVVRLEPRGRDDRVAGRDLRQPLLLLLVGAGAQQHARAHHRAHEVRRRRQRAAELLVDDDAVEHRSSPSRRTRSGSSGRCRSSSAELLPELGRSSRPGRPRARAPSRATRTSCTRRAPSRAASPARRERSRSIGQLLVTIITGSSRRRGGSRGCRRRAIGQRDARGAVGLEVAVDGQAHEQRRPAAAGVVGLDAARPSPRSTIVSPGNTEPFMRNFMRPSRPVGPGPVGDVALEPRGLVRRVQEDVLGAVAVRPRSRGRGASAASRALASAPSTTVVAVTS